MWGRNGRRKRTAEVHAACALPYLQHSIVSLVLFSLMRNAGAVNLYSFETHQKLSKGDQQSAVLQLNTTFVFLEQNYTEIVVSIISLTSPTKYLARI